MFESLDTCNSLKSRWYRVMDFSSKTLKSGLCKRCCKVSSISAGNTKYGFAFGAGRVDIVIDCVGKTQRLFKSVWGVSKCH